MNRNLKKQMGDFFYLYLDGMNIRIWVWEWIVA